MAKAPPALSALDFLAHPGKHPVKPICVVYGDEMFLKRQVLEYLQTTILAGDDSEFALSTFNGDDIEQPRQVFDELATVALFGGGQRVVLINDADTFVSRNRAALEDYVAHPRSTGVLILEVKTWPSNTKLFKAVADTGLQVDCKTPAGVELSKWMRIQSEKQYGARLDPAAADRLFEIVGPEMGRLDQELLKLSVLANCADEGAGKSTTITPDLVDNHVGGWQVKKAWDMIDLALAGDAAHALLEYDRLVSSGEEPIALLSMMAASMRRMGAATRAIEDAEAEGRRLSLRQALEQAGVKAWPAAMDKAERQLKQLGRQRSSRLFAWLLDADLALKGSSSAGDRKRLVVEELIVRMARQPEASRR